ncbi:ribosomal pseudouridine synthase, putative [Entamoeba invadens IP1]|uniref:Pseudouridine synthase n=1 Tax=Entamoeba invadens IP1 TaxID=370355 RepID=A0A0A1U1C8_ENTIV|nr:ribosomal pseudouridine synthase, putative [Entamoeba invadens IP1]ELP87849.1 ribosomal pseudouridine synthase, putative [Entamoeba invadens IP1]|eukprot:XP_004254620.1 ribosomal pseudouridine synthase, putative [Entamoeba invadens IP1]
MSDSGRHAPRKPIDETNASYQLSLKRKKAKALEREQLKKVDEQLDLITAEELLETTYYFENNYRRVQPYYYNFKVNAKGRWVGKSIVEVFVSEFKVCDVNGTELAIQRGDITVNDLPTTLSYKVRMGDHIGHRVHRHEPPVTSQEVKIIKETQDFIVVDKPGSIPVHPCGRYRHNTVVFIMASLGLKTLRPVHRLDRMTSGILILAKSADAARRVGEKICSKQTAKVYLIRVRGKMSEMVTVEGKIGRQSKKEKIDVMVQHIDEEKGKASKSQFEPLFYDEKSNTTVITGKLESGRTHQLRVHLKEIGHPVANDPIYGAKFDSTKHCDDDGIIESEYKGDLKKWEKVDWCDECNKIKGDPEQLEIYLHAWKYEIDGEKFETDVPWWAKREADVTKELEKWKANHILE